MKAGNTVVASLNAVHDMSPLATETDGLSELLSEYPDSEDDKEGSLKSLKTATTKRKIEKMKTIN